MRKRLGGAMRQAGVIAAAGIVTLQNMVERLSEDHANAQRLVEGLSAIDGVDIEAPEVMTNILKVDVGQWGWTAEQLVHTWKEHGILSNPRPPHGARLVTHRHISAADVRRHRDNAENGTKYALASPLSDKRPELQLGEEINLLIEDLRESGLDEAQAAALWPLVGRAQTRTRTTLFKTGTRRPSR